MRSKKLFMAAFKSIRKNGMRSLLTMLGIIIGVSAVIIMVAVGQGTQVVKDNVQEHNGASADSHVRDAASREPIVGCSPRTRYRVRMVTSPTR